MTSAPAILPMSYFQRFPFVCMKVDRSFVAHLGNRAENPKPGESNSGPWPTAWIWKSSPEGIEN